MGFIGILLLGPVLPGIVSPVEGASHNAESISEWRIKPARLDAELIEFVDQVYAAESTASSPGVTA